MARRLLVAAAFAVAGCAPSDSGSVAPTGESFEIDSHCGVRTFGFVDDTWWGLPEGQYDNGAVPAEWLALMDPAFAFGGIPVVLEFVEEPLSVEATANGLTLTYFPIERPPACE